MELVKGSQVLVSVDPTFQTRGDANTVWVDYPNIIRVVPVGGHIYIDDGLISLVVKRIGADAPPAPAARGAARALFPPAPAFAPRTRPTPAGVLTQLVPGAPSIQTPGLTLAGGWTGGVVLSSTQVHPVPVTCGAQAEGRRTNRIGRGS